MKAAELVNFNERAMKAMSEVGIKIGDYRHLVLWNDYTALIADGIFGNELLHACALCASALYGCQVEAWAAALCATLSIVIIIVQHFSLSSQEPSSIKFGKRFEYTL